MLTEDKIQACMDEVSDETLAELLRDEECFHTGLAKALVSFATYDSSGVDIGTMVGACLNVIHDHQYKLAAKIAQDKDDASRFQADMKDKFE
jgi:hypothetical protein